ncbi:MAG: DNA repair exonuclease SbcCD ATPase subunit [Candidatus Latescibacterota bacterium]
MENNRRIILVVGAAAVVLAIILYIAFLPEGEGPLQTQNPRVAQLEKEVELYTAQIDSMDSVVDGLNNRIDLVRTQMDSSRASNKVLLASLHRVTRKMQEYERLYKEQRTANDQLRNEITQVKTERDRSLTQAQELKSAVDSLNNELYTQTISLTRLESTLEEALEESKDLKKTVNSVLVYVGTEDALKQQGYLNTSRFIRKGYKVTGFPDVNNAQILRIPVGETFTLQGELNELCDRHGKLGKGDEYEVSKGAQGQSIISFTDELLVGQRILAVIK